PGGKRLGNAFDTPGRRSRVHAGRGSKASRWAPAFAGVTFMLQLCFITPITKPSVFPSFPRTRETSDWPVGWVELAKPMLHESMGIAALNTILRSAFSVLADREVGHVLQALDQPGVVPVAA